MKIIIWRKLNSKPDEQTFKMHWEFRVEFWKRFQLFQIQRFRLLFMAVRSPDCYLHLFNFVRLLVDFTFICLRFRIRSPVVCRCHFLRENKFANSAFKTNQNGWKNGNLRELLLILTTTQSIWFNKTSRNESCRSRIWRQFRWSNFR